MRGLRGVEALTGQRALLEQVLGAVVLEHRVGQRRLGASSAALRDVDRGVGRVDLRVDLARDRCVATTWPARHAIADVDQHALEPARQLRADADAGLRREPAGNLQRLGHVADARAMAATSTARAIRRRASAVSDRRSRQRWRRPPRPAVNATTVAGERATSYATSSMAPADRCDSQGRQAGGTARATKVVGTPVLRPASADSSSSRASASGSSPGARRQPRAIAAGPWSAPRGRASPPRGWCRARKCRRRCTAGRLPACRASSRTRKRTAPIAGDLRHRAIDEHQLEVLRLLFGELVVRPKQPRAAFRADRRLLEVRSPAGASSRKPSSASAKKMSSLLGK